MTGAPEGDEDGGAAVRTGSLGGAAARFTGPPGADAVALVVALWPAAAGTGPFAPAADLGFLGFLVFDAFDTPSKASAKLGLDRAGPSELAAGALGDPGPGAGASPVGGRGVIVAGALTAPLPAKP